MNLGELIKSGTDVERIINFVLNGIADKIIDNSKFYKFFAYAGHCPLLEFFASMNPVPTPEMCRKAINNKNHEIWSRMAGCEYVLNRLSVMRSLADQSPETPERKRLSDIADLIIKIRSGREIVTKYGLQQALCQFPGLSVNADF